MAKNYDIYIITLEKSYNRFNKTIIPFKKNNIEYIKFIGINGKSLSNDIKESLTTPICYHLCSSGIIGCAYSHINVWNKLANSNKDYAIIFEDDANVKCKELLDLIPVIEKYLDTFDIIHLFYSLSSKGTNTYILNDTYKLIEINCNIVTIGYIMTHKCASILTNYFKYNRINYHIDIQLNNVCRDLYIKRAVISPSIVINDGYNTSTMAVHNKHFIKYFPLYYTISFPLCTIYDKYVINNFTLFIILLIILLIILRVTNPIIWFIVGLLLSDAF